MGKAAAVRTPASFFARAGDPSPSTDRIPSRTAGGPFRPGDGSSVWSHALRVTSTGSTFTPWRFASSISVPGA